MQLVYSHRAVKVNQNNTCSVLACKRRTEPHHKAVIVQWKDLKKKDLLPTAQVMFWPLVTIVAMALNIQGGGQAENQTNNVWFWWRHDNERTSCSVDLFGWRSQKSIVFTHVEDWQKMTWLTLLMAEELRPISQRSWLSDTDIVFICGYSALFCVSFW